MGDRTADLLDKAADVLTERGWHRGGWLPLGRDVDVNTCNVCVLAAINVAAGASPWRDFEEENTDTFDAAIALAEHLGHEPMEDHEDIAEVIGNQWNDDQTRTAEDVITALREAAAAERGRTS
ncbi:DUF6197 family protein [Actinomadura alba]|uniref:Uncharacterized protein n=1 Tax=Actinomadura alba TaxID=406431 RepID=A0ABR7LHM3_9ACTN|nr:hypothetical protein [Actinomadura alba]MBC6464288.1 hypothetical protein [Actinomadura alba]